MHFPMIRLEPPPVYFMHIPKTAGSSLRNLLFSAYPQPLIGRIYYAGLYKVTPAELPGLRCIASHSGPGLLPWLPQPGLACVTILRDPVEQFVSHLYYRQSELNRRVHSFQPAYLERMQPLLQANLRTLIELSSTLVPDNPQTRCLGAVQNLRPYFKDGEIGSKGQARLEMPFAFSLGMDLRQVAADAHRQLEGMAVVGITEQFATSAELLCDFLGIAVPAQLPTHNLGGQKHKVQATHYRHQLAPDLIEQIQAKTTYDQELYGHACERFATQWARHRTKAHRTISLGPRIRCQYNAEKQFIQRIQLRARKRVSSKLRLLCQWIQ